MVVGKQDLITIRVQKSRILFICTYHGQFGRGGIVAFLRCWTSLHVIKQSLLRSFYDWISTVILYYIIGLWESFSYIGNLNFWVLKLINCLWIPGMSAYFFLLFFLPNLGAWILEICYNFMFSVWQPIDWCIVTYI